MDDLRQVFADLAATLLPEQRAYSGECHPALDVLETDAVEIVVDVAGRAGRAVRVLFRGDVLIIAGEKAPPRRRPSRPFTWSSASSAASRAPCA